MQIVKTKTELALILEKHRKSGETIGFVPTMGALHEGHLSLIQASKRACKITVCSIFVNPTQFNDISDLEKYPRTPEKDSEMLEKAGCDLLFMPEVNEIYPEKDTRKFDFGYLDEVLEGAHRPGHFNGVAQVVSKLFDMVKPDKAFFGIKDYQQVLIIKDLVRQLKLNIEIVECPILRESDGLAMSSRNTRLDPSERKAAATIPAVMLDALQLKGSGRSVDQIYRFVEKKLDPNPIFNLDYFAICEADTLKEVSKIEPGKPYVALIACFVGKIRLIDNIALN
jgi:pantoate--beta-alanine ligase